MVLACAVSPVHTWLHISVYFLNKSSCLVPHPKFGCSKPRPSLFQISNRFPFVLDSPHMHASSPFHMFSTQLLFTHFLLAYAQMQCLITSRIVFLNHSFLGRVTCKIIIRTTETSYITFCKNIVFNYYVVNNKVIKLFKHDSCLGKYVVNPCGHIGLR